MGVTQSKHSFKPETAASPNKEIAEVKPVEESNGVTEHKPATENGTTENETVEVKSNGVHIQENGTVPETDETDVPKENGKPVEEATTEVTENGCTTPEKVKKRRNVKSWLKKRISLKKSKSLRQAEEGENRVVPKITVSEEAEAASEQTQNDLQVESHCGINESHIPDETQGNSTEMNVQTVIDSVISKPLVEDIKPIQAECTESCIPKALTNLEVDIEPIQAESTESSIPKALTDLEVDIEPMHAECTESAAGKSCPKVDEEPKPTVRTPISNSTVPETEVNVSVVSQKVEMNDTEISALTDNLMAKDTHSEEVFEQEIMTETSENVGNTEEEVSTELVDESSKHEFVESDESKIGETQVSDEKVLNIAIETELVSTEPVNKENVQSEEAKIEEELAEITNNENIEAKTEKVSAEAVDVESIESDETKSADVPIEVNEVANNESIEADEAKVEERSDEVNNGNIEAPTEEVSNETIENNETITKEEAVSTENNETGETKAEEVSNEEVDDDENIENDQVKAEAISNQSNPDETTETHAQNYYAEETITDFKPPIDIENEPHEEDCCESDKKSEKSEDKTSESEEHSEEQTQEVIQNGAANIVDEVVESVEKKVEEIVEAQLKADSADKVKEDVKSEDKESEEPSKPEVAESTPVEQTETPKTESVPESTSEETPATEES